MASFEGLAAHHAARDPPPGACVWGAAWEVELVTGVLFPMLSGGGLYYGN